MFRGDWYAPGQSFTTAPRNEVERFYEAEPEQRTIAFYIERGLIEPV